MRIMSKKALKLFDQSNLNNCNFIIIYVINNNICLYISDISFLLFVLSWLKNIDLGIFLILTCQFLNFSLCYT